MLYRKLVGLYEKLDATSSRLEKTDHIAQFLAEVEEDLAELMLLIEGKVFPAWEERTIGVSNRLAIQAIQKATGQSVKSIEKSWKKLGDLGDVARDLLAKNKQQSLVSRELTVQEVFDNLQKLASLEGPGSTDMKTDMIADMLIAASPKEAKYIIRIAVDNLRLGIGSGTIRDALVWPLLDIAYDKEKNEIDVEDREQYNAYSERVQLAYDMTNDWGEVAGILKKKGIEGLEDISMTIGKPINVMLFQKAADIQDAFDTVGRPAAFEYKYDGMRMQIHKGKDIHIFTRRLDDVTEQFPEVVEAVEQHVKKDCILDAEAVGYNPKSGKYWPFQKISQRIKRKYDIDKLAKKFPVEVNVFDVIYAEKSLIKEPFEKRRQILEKLIDPEPKAIVPAEQLVTDDEQEALAFIDDAQKAGEEGVMAKSLEAEYKPGSRVGYGVKIKSIMEPLDLVIIAADYGEGKRSGWLTSFYLAVEDHGELKEIGKVSTGFKELEEQGTSFAEMTRLLEPLIMKSEAKHIEVRPEIVIEVGYEEIQKSTTYGSGYALRFPRFRRLRTDEKSVEDINTLDDVEMLYKKQRGRNA